MWSDFVFIDFLSADIRNKIEKSKERFLQYDDNYFLDMEHLKDFEERYEELDLTFEQRLFINDYIALLETVKIHNDSLSYFTGFFDAIKIAKKKWKP